MIQKDHHQEIKRIKTAQNLIFPKTQILQICNNLFLFLLQYDRVRQILIIEM